MRFCGTEQEDDSDCKSLYLARSSVSIVIKNRCVLATYVHVRQLDPAFDVCTEAVDMIQELVNRLVGLACSSKYRSITLPDCPGGKFYENTTCTRLH